MPLPFSYGPPSRGQQVVGQPPWESLSRQNPERLDSVSLAKGRGRTGGAWRSRRRRAESSARWRNELGIGLGAVIYGLRQVRDNRIRTDKGRLLAPKQCRPRADSYLRHGRINALPLLLLLLGAEVVDVGFRVDHPGVHVQPVVEDPSLRIIRVCRDAPDQPQCDSLESFELGNAARYSSARTVACILGLVALSSVLCAPGSAAGMWHTSTTTGSSFSSSDATGGTAWPGCVTQSGASARRPGLYDRLQPRPPTAVG